MKKFLVLFLMLILSIPTLSGCGNNSNKISYANKYVFGQDSQENCIETQGVANLAESKDCYYYVNSENSFLYVIDKKTRKCMPLCNKTNCLHDKETSPKKCNAYISSSSGQVIYYEDNLYYTSERESTDKDGVVHFVTDIVCSSLDGSTKKTIYSTEKYNIYNFKIHRGYIYANLILIGKNGAESYDASLYKIPLKENSKETEFLPFKKYYDKKKISVTDMRFYGNNLILEFNKFLGNDDGYNILVNYDLKTDKWINLNKKIKDNVDSFITVCNGNIYYSIDNKVYCCDLNGNNIKCIFDNSKKAIKQVAGLKYFDPYSNDGKNVIISVSDDKDVSKNVIFYDTDTGKTEIKHIPSEMGVRVGGDENSLIYMYNNTLYYFDKEKDKSYSMYKFDN